jgi:hypothetical protein
MVALQSYIFTRMTPISRIILVQLGLTFLFFQPTFLSFTVPETYRLENEYNHGKPYLNY